MSTRYVSTAQHTSSTSERTTCDVLGCDAGAPKTYLDARHGRVLNFRLCEEHFTRLTHGAQAAAIPVPASPAEVAVGRPVLLMSPALT